jgi:SNF2 family DNA or RNA helicase
MVEETLQACTVLEPNEDLDGEWHLDEPEDCLELLTELQGLGDKVCVDWPEGARFKITRQVSFDGFHIAIKRENDWFSLNGEIRLNEDKVMELRQLLELLDATPGRFLPLGNGEFLALTKEFRKRLDDLASLSERHAKGVRFHPLAAPAIEELTAGTDLETDSQWKEQMTRIRSAQALQPVVPSTLQAELRDYQTEGYAWLARLAHWGVGACLADDMGLGKTIQALALMISRAANGPSLVAAPTSVCMNWMEEAKRFAPTLNVFQFGAGDRKETVASLRPFDLMVCSYGLLQQEEELLASVAWETIVLDEAQAIKNAATMRSQAAMKLQGRFKIITTGTPVENHLDELWNLFRFINPGLLGSLDAFNRRFANPIERGNDHQARARLKRLIQPFILRRLKTQVLTELPQKTEIILHVELGEEETALYEAMRRQSLDRIARVEGNMGRKSIQILAEIMRLRRLCCNSRLVVPDTKTRSSKFELFVETLEELLDNKHKALIFSQFVDHLAIMREFLEGKKIPYQYIDGSTPPRERKRSVDAFQAGDGDVFLISLKAGGLGLNLTAADYVMHMDPWWNPAVEDQASDRAYRIGQERPVTIYRLITKGTIEEKIVDLHKHKRDLADSLLEGSDMSGRISPDELLQLLVEPADSKK